MNSANHLLDSLRALWLTEENRGGGVFTTKAKMLLALAPLLEQSSEVVLCEMNRTRRIALIRHLSVSVTEQAA